MLPCAQEFPELVVKTRVYTSVSQLSKQSTHLKIFLKAPKLPKNFKHKEVCVFLHKQLNILTFFHSYPSSTLIWVYKNVLSVKT
jgi:hypothetical protein